MKGKKRVSLLLALCMALALTACGGGKVPPSTGTSQPEPPSGAVTEDPGDPGGDGGPAATGAHGGPGGD